MAHDHHDNVDPGFAGSCFVCGAAGHRTAAHPEGDKSALSRRSLMKAATVAPVALTALGIPRLAAAQGQPEALRASRRTGDLIVEAGWVLVPRNNSVDLLRDASILIRNDRIEEVRQGRIPGDAQRLSVPDQLVVPGFISGHTHACSATPTRGIIEGGRSFARPLEVVEMLSDEEMDALTAFNVWELLRSGCTTHVEQSLSLRQAESYVRVATKWGVRGYPGGMIPGIARLFPIWFRQNDQALTDSVPETLKEIAANLAFGKKHNGAANGRILPQMAPHATDTQTPETMRAIAAAAKELGNGIHIHLSQSARETQTVKRLWGVTPTQWCEQHGFFDGPFFAAHMSGMDFAVDPPIMNRLGGVYSHCPSGGGAGGGTQPYPEALAAGMKVNIGIDTHSNDYIENLKLAVIYGQARFSILKDSSPTPMKNPTIWAAIEGATLIAADGLRRKDLGRIEAGAKADLVSIDVTGPLVGTGALPPEPLNNLLYAHGLSVRYTMTDGQFQIYDGQLVVDDPVQVAMAGGKAVQKVWDKLRQEDWFKPTER